MALALGTDDESIQAEMKAYRDILNGVKEQPTIPYDMKWNPDCEDCLPEGIEDCIECHKRQEGSVKTMPDREKVIKGLELCEIGSGDRCYETECPYYGQGCTENLKNDILALLKEQEAVKCPTDHDNELTWHVLFTARQHVEECLNKARVRYGGETAEFLMFAKGIRDACWAIDELISTHNEGTEQNDE